MEGPLPWDEPGRSSLLGGWLGSPPGQHSQLLSLQTCPLGPWEEELQGKDFKVIFPVSLCPLFVP